MSTPEGVPLNAFYEAVVLTDGDFRITQCNDRAVQLLRVSSRADLIGRRVSEIPSEHDISGEFPTDLRERLKAVPFVLIESRISREDKTSFIAETIAHRISDDQFLFKIRDVTARVENLRRIEEANERLRATYRAQLEFVSNVSHDLRTPLTSMSYALTNMRRGICGTLPPRALDYIDRLQVDVRRLLTTVNDLLDLRKIESGTLTLHKTDIPLYRLLTDCVQEIRIQAETKHQTLSLVPSTTEFYAFADRHHIERAFFNVLSNAVKYTPEGGTIQASISSDETTTTIQVDDNGIGIPPEALPRVTQRYFRVGEQVEGTGLGLSIVHEILELHGGSLQIVSPVPGTQHGTRVTLSLPKVAGPLAVIISGDETFIQTLTEQLHALGNTVFVDRQATSLATELQGLQPALFIIDGSLPQGCLSELIYQIRSLPNLAPTPVHLFGSEKSTFIPASPQLKFHAYPLSLEALRTTLYHP